LVELVVDVVGEVEAEALVEEGLREGEEGGGDVVGGFEDVDGFVVVEVVL
jgi:hypothetical protein